MKKKSILIKVVLMCFLTSCSTSTLPERKVQKLDENLNFYTKNNSIYTSENNIDLFNTGEKLNIKTLNIPSSEGTTPNNGISYPDSFPEANLVKNLEMKKKYMGDADFPKKYSKAFTTKTCCGTGQLHWGARIKKISSLTNNSLSVFSRHSIQTGLTFSNQDTVMYSPTLMPPNNAPVEVSTVYYRAPGSSNTQRAFGIWDHQLGSFQVYEAMDNTTWQNKYTINYTDGRFYSAEIDKVGTTWKVQIYNASTSSWEVKYSKDFGTFQTVHDDGWDFHEPKWDNDCPSLPAIKISGLQVYNGSSWYYNNSVNNGYAHYSGYYCPSWTYNWINNYYEWKIN